MDGGRQKDQQTEYSYKKDSRKLIVTRRWYFSASFPLVSLAEASLNGSQRWWQDQNAPRTAGMARFWVQVSL
jgi:hypothetical protein